MLLEIFGISCLILNAASQLCTEGKKCPEYLPFCTPAGCVYQCPDNVFINGTSCVQHCDDNFIYNKTCVSTCPDGHHLIEEQVVSISYQFYKLRLCQSNCRKDMFDNNGSCVNSCPSGRKAVDQGRCVEECPASKPIRRNITSGTYLLGTECRSTCDNESPQPFLQDDMCVSQCNENSVMFDGRCLSNCPTQAPFLLDLQTCQKLNKCSANWLNQTYCSSFCPLKWFIANNRCVEVCPEQFPYSYKGHCVSKCPDTFYSGVSLLDTDSGEMSILICFITCPDGKKKNPLTMECVDECPQNMKTFDDICVHVCPTDFLERNTCVDTCRSFVLNGTCVDECPTNMKLFDKTCVADCPHSTFTDVNDHSNVPVCVSKCNKYAINNTCVAACPENAKNVADGVCVARCPDARPYTNTVHVPGSSDWINTCVERCSSNSNNVTFECVDSCPKGTSMYHSFCLNSCPPNSFVIKNDIDNKEICVDICEKYSLNGTCVDSCPEYVLDVICVNNCPANRRFLFNNECLNVCPNNTCLLDDSKTCTMDCMYDIFNKVLVHKCPPVTPLRKFQDAKPTCVSACGEYELVDNGTCINITDCHRAVVSSGKCEDSCPEGYFYSNFQSSGSSEFDGQYHLYSYRPEDIKNQPCMHKSNTVLATVFCGILVAVYGIFMVDFLTPSRRCINMRKIIKNTHSKRDTTRATRSLLNDDDAPLLNSDIVVLLNDDDVPLINSAPLMNDDNVASLNADDVPLINSSDVPLVNDDNVVSLSDDDFPLFNNDDVSLLNASQSGEDTELVDVTDSRRTRLYTPSGRY